MSAILSTETLNDFIAPSVACIKPIETLPASSPPSTSALEHEVILDGTHKDPSAPAQITLTDCLACSGCVTSAEAILVSLQSHAEVLNTLDVAPALRMARGRDGEGDVDMAGAAEGVEGLEDEERRIFVASVSPQTRASLAAACGKGVSERQAGVMLERLLREELAKGGKWGNGFTWVVDTNTAREACLVLGADEVLSQGPSSPKPVLASSCPGWVCYAEKTHPYVLPHLSKVKSPQALMGTLLKTTLSKRLGVPPNRIWHLAVMPCFDKKLEASREELMDTAWQGQGGRGVRDVDCVITSKEVLMLAESRGFDFFGLSDSSPAPQPPFPDPQIQRFLFPPQAAYRSPQSAGTSGGNLHFILETVAWRNPGSQIQSSRGRNADVMEYTVVSPNGEPLFKAARYYGFRNIQNLVRKLKPAKPSRMPGGKPFGSARRPGAGGKPGTMDFAYVEVMACPGGCTNGGGQIKVDDPIVIQRTGLETKPGPQEQKEWLALVDEAYFSSDESNPQPNGRSNGNGSTNGNSAMDLVDGISPSYIRDTLAYWSNSTGIDADRLALTSFREVISDVGKDKTQTERAAQIAGKIGGGW